MQESIAVVNCSQNVSLKYRKQHKQCMLIAKASCELLSKCIFEIPRTTEDVKATYFDGCELLSKCIFEIPKTTTWFSLPFSNKL